MQITRTWEVGQRVASGVPLGAEVNDYLNNQPPLYQQSLRNGIVDLFQHATPAFREQCEAPLAVTIPVAAAQERHSVEPALSAFGAQKQAPPHRILLYANYPPGKGDSRGVTATLDAIDIFMRKRPDVPVAYVTGPLNGEFAMGGLRRFIADVALALLVESPSSADALHINHDIDLVRLHPLYLARMWQKFTQADRLTTTVTSAVRHALSWGPDGTLTNPNMDGVTIWHDALQLFFNGYYDLANGVSYRAYMAVNGYDPRQIGGETLDLISRIHQGHNLYHPGLQRVPNAHVFTSQRRIYDRLLSNPAVLTSFWPKVGPRMQQDLLQGNYRGFPLTYMPDISEQQRDKFIHGLSYRAVAHTALAAMHHHPTMTREQAIARARRTLSVARLVLNTQT